MKNTVAITLSLLLIIGFGLFLNHKVNGNSVSISISDSDDELSLSAHFPREESTMVHKYLKKRFNMNDLSDMEHVEIKRYKAPGEDMIFYIKSRAGYVKIVMDKTENSAKAYRKLKETAEGLKKILAHR
jgi:hypothetical protein